MMPWADSRICPNQPFGRHIVVRCLGCGSRHSTKNIGWRDAETKVVSPARSVFDIYDETCKCEDPSRYPLVHDCEIDDIKYDYTTKTFSAIKKEGGE